MNRRDVGRLRQMFAVAEEDRDALIDAHQITRLRGGRWQRIVPREYRALVARCRREVAAWRRLVDKLAKGGGA